MISLYLTDCRKLVKIPGLDKRSSPIVYVDMGGCRNLTYTFKQSLLQEWATGGIGSLYGIFLPSNQIPYWFTYKGEGPSVRSAIRNGDLILKGFALCIVYSSRVMVLSFIVVER
ncbi:hypothetical protein SLA2020_277010 [Shorea laevis]